MANCWRCDATISLLTGLFGGGACSICKREIKQVVQRLYQEMSQAIDQDGVTEEFYTYVLKELEDNDVPDSYSASLNKEVEYQRHLTDISQGNLPLIEVDAILDTDEVAHFEAAATYYKPNTQVRHIDGNLIATNKKLYFITTGRDSMRIDWNNVVNVDIRPGKTPRGRAVKLMLIQVSKGVGGGLYHVPDPYLAAVLIETAVRLWKRHLVELKENPNAQGIPEHVKTAVFQRDGGKCRQCGYMGPYIEYDHIIPRSKGGPNTVDNIQLLCSKCNRKKGNRM